jgi:chemotaxis signal transduction protein
LRSCSTCRACCCCEVCECDRTIPPRSGEGKDFAIDGPSIRGPDSCILILMAKEDRNLSGKPEIRVGPIPLALLAPEQEDVRPGIVSLLSFEIGQKAFAIAVEHTEGVVDCPRISPLPSPPDGMVGIASVRGKMTLVMDLSVTANLNDAKRRLILVKGESQLGLLAERVEGVLALEPEQLHKVEAGKEPVGLRGFEISPWPVRAYFDSRGKRVPVIDVEQLAQL